MISDEELRRRLKERNYPVPPITDSTRRVLLRKLKQLESGRKKRDLLEYSSADDDGTMSPVDEPRLKRRVLKETVKRRMMNGYSSKAYLKNPLLSHSETEEDDEEEQSSRRGGRNNMSAQTSPKSEMEEEEEEDEEEEDDEEEDDEEEDEDEDPRFRRPRSDNDRFLSSTPINAVRSTASYLETPSSSSSSSPLRFNAEFSPLSSPALRKTIAKNKDSFGSLGNGDSLISRIHNVPCNAVLLGEALSSLPRNSSSSSVGSNSSTFPNGNIVAQASASLQKEFRTKRSTFCNSHSISKIIICLAGIFFSILAFKYSNLRPNPDIGHRINVCSGPPSSSEENCVNSEDVEKFIKLYKELVGVLEKKEVEILCARDGGARDFERESQREKFKNETFSIAKEELYSVLKNYPHNEYVDVSLLSRLIDLLHQNPQWGVIISPDKGHLTLYNPPIGWKCWISLKIGFTYSVLCAISLWLLKGSVLLAVFYGIYRWRIWYRDRRLRENQDVFELVEHVLSILATQNTLVLREGRGSSSSPYIAINHIRDQLISPQDRAKKKRLWEKVVKYIRECESRVREDVQNIYGEETKVWQWIPDIRWGNSSISQHGPNPYVPAVAPPPSPSPQWQGSAFSSLNKNVAAPQVAPTTCLKVRHMFDRQTIQNNPGKWVLQVKEEILRRCAPSANILHIAVDRQSPEGCVYIKAMDTDGAGVVFRCLHGQWYRGNLVTVKYLREERYHERFPDSKAARAPLIPSTT